MKTNVFFCFLIIALRFNAQNINGYYQSSETSFKDDLNPENNFQAKGIFDVLINYNETNLIGNTITIKESSVKKMFTYRLSYKPITLPANKYYKVAYLFKNCFSETSKTKLDILIYYSLNNTMCILLLGGGRSQSLKKMIIIS